jgi:hypothetical protein
MANAKQCDRCDKFYKPYDGLPFGEPITNPLYMYIGITLDAKERGCGMVMDLCPECMGKLIKFLRYEDNNCENEVNEEGRGDI